VELLGTTTIYNYLQITTILPPTENSGAKVTIILTSLKISAGCSSRLWIVHTDEVRNLVYCHVCKVCSVALEDNCTNQIVPFEISVVKQWNFFEVAKSFGPGE